MTGVTVEYIGAGNDIPVITDCDLCPGLVACRKQVVNGDGDESPDILFVGQNPGPDENANGRPFIGRIGQLLGALCDLVGIAKRKTRRVNAVRCFSCNNEKPSPTEVDNCHDFLLQEIRGTNPRLIVGLGETSLDSLYLLPRRREAMAYYERETVPEWERANERILTEYTGNIAAWENACTAWKDAGATKGTGQPKPRKPLKPKMLPRPKAPTKQKMSMASIVGHTLVQPETGIPLIMTYHPSWLMRDNWGKGDLVVAQFEKIKRLADGEVQEELGEYVTIKTIPQLEALRDYLLADEVDTIYFDTETYGGIDDPGGGLNWKTNELLCISLAGRSGEGYVVPILDQFGEPFYPWIGKYKRVVEILGEIFGSDKDKAAHNTLFDLRMLERKRGLYVTGETAFGIKVNGRLKDTELAHQIVAESLPHNETTVLSLHTRMPYYESDIHHLSHNKRRMDLVPLEVMHPYSAADADSLPRIEEVLDTIIEEEGTRFVLDQIANPLLRLCWDMEQRGVPIDEEYFGSLCRFYDARIVQAEDALRQSVPDYEWERGFKYTYPPVLQDLLFHHLGLHIPDRKTKASRTCDACKMGLCFSHIQTGKDALLDIKAVTPHPVLDCLLTLKGLTKTKSTYLDGGKGGWKQHISPGDKRIHPSAKISRAETGRLAFEKPNVHNPPKGIHIHPVPTICEGKPCKNVFTETFGINSRNAFRDIVTAEPGKVIVNADWSQLEVWVLAYFLRDYFDDMTLLDILESGKDIHTAVARMIWSEIDAALPDHEWRNIHNDLRSKAKPVVFGTNYGLTIHGLMERGHFDEAEATSIMTRYEANVPGLPKYKAFIREMLYKHGYVPNRFDRRRHSKIVNVLRQLNKKNELESLVRENFNFPIQSGGSDMHSYISVATNNYAPLLERGCVALFSVHDSLTFETDAPNNEYVIETAWIIRELWMGLARTMPTPNGDPLDWHVPMECEWGQKWGTPEWKLNARGELEDLRETA